MNHKPAVPLAVLGWVACVAIWVLFFGVLLSFVRQTASTSTPIADWSTNSFTEPETLRWESLPPTSEVPWEATIDCDSYPVHIISGSREWQLSLGAQKPKLRRIK